ncbi:MAG: efflux RND transporter periplasmic adaptor subunit [Pseudomonadota bacterium]
MIRTHLNSAALVTLVLVLVACSPSEQAEDQNSEPVVRPVKVVSAARGSTGIQRTYSALVLPSQEVELSFRVSGRIVELPVRGGVEVKKDDVVAQLDTRDFEAEISRVKSQMEQAQAQLAALKSGARSEDVASLQAAVGAAQAQVDAAKEQVERSRKLFEERVVAKAKLDNDLTALRVAEAELEARQQELNKGQAGARAEDVAAQEASIRGLESQLKSLQDSLSDATLRAPFDGIIAERNVENFANIQAKETVATLQTLSTLNLVFDVPGPDVVQLAKIQDLNLKVTLDSLPGQEFEATRSEFSTKADPATQTYRGRVAIKNPEGEFIFPGMTGNLVVSAKQDTDANVRVPVSALSADPDGKPFVWVVDPANNTTSQRMVETGGTSADTIELTSGIKPGELVVTAGVSALQDGMTVRPITAVGE